MWNRSFHRWLAWLGGLAVTCILATGCFHPEQKEVSLEASLVGSWKRQDGDVEIVLQIVDAERIFEVFRGATVYQGDWAVEGDKLLMEPAIATLATGEQLDVEDVDREALVPTYRIVAVEPNTLRLHADSDSGQPDTFARIRYDERLVGEWKSQEGGIQMTFHRFDGEKGYGDYELSRWSNEFKGEWRLAGKTLHLELTVAKLATGEEKDVRATAPLVTYRLVSVQPDVLLLDPGDGQTSTYTRVAGIASDRK